MKSLMFPFLWDTVYITAYMYHKTCTIKPPDLSAVQMPEWPQDISGMLKVHSHLETNSGNSTKMWTD